MASELCSIQQVLERGSTVLDKDCLWYVVRTRQYKEQIIARVVSLFVEETYVPLLRTKRRGLGRLLDRIEPLFPCYFFARVKLSDTHYRLTHTPGVVGLVCVGGEPCAVDPSVVEGIKNREKNGLVVINSERLRPRQRVTISEGALRGIDALFERYVSGAERVAVLLHSIGRGDIRAILRADAITPISA